MDGHQELMWRVNLEGNPVWEQTRLELTAARQKVGELQRAIRAYNGICVWHRLDDRSEHFPHTCKAPVLCELASPGASPATLTVPIPASVATLEDTVRRLTRRVAELAEAERVMYAALEQLAALAATPVTDDVWGAVEVQQALLAKIHGVAVDALAQAEADRGEAPRGEEG